MLPHPHTAVVLCELDYQELLRDAAKERLAASAEAGASPRPTTSWPARLATASWLNGLVTRVRGAKREQASCPPGSGAARPAHHGI